MRHLLPLLVLLAVPAAGQIVINEILAENHVVIQDQDGESSDWVELRNTGPAAVNLAGWFLTDDLVVPFKWQFPSVNLGAGAYLVVFASGKNRAVAGQQLHTNFELASTGEYLALVQPGGAVAASVAPQFPAQYTDVSWGFAGTGTTTRVYSSAPTPGFANGAGTTVIVNVTTTPATPGNNDNIVVAATTISPPGVTVTQVLLRYRVNYGAEGAFPMSLVNSRWTALISAAASGPGDFVRWKVTSTNSLGQASRNPLFQSAVNTPEYHGTMIPDPGVVSSLDVLYWAVQSPAGAATFGGTRCSLWYRGEFYDNVDVRLRGGSSTGWPKVSYKFDFNTGHHFNFDPAVPRVEEINLNSTFGDKAFIRQILCYETLEAAGAPGSRATPIRIQQNKLFHSVAIAVEQPDIRLLERVGLNPRGALYKMYNECTSEIFGVEKQTRLFENNADLAALVAGVQLTGTALETYLCDNLDLPAVLDHLAATCLIHDNDHIAKNYYLYRDSEGDGEWLLLPWDKDLTFGRNYTLTGGVTNDTIWATLDPYSHPLFGDQLHPKVDGPWNRLIDAVYRVPRIRAMYLRRLRTVMDKLLQPPGTPLAQRLFEARIAQLQTLMLADCNLDQAAWGVPGYGNPALNFTAASNEIATAYLGPRRTHLYVTHGTGPGGTIPAAQAGPYSVRFGLVDPSLSLPAQGWVQLRNCGNTAVDVSRWVVAGPIAMIIAPGTVIPAQDVLYLAASVPGFRGRSVSPKGGERLLVAGPWNGVLPANAPLILLDDQFQLVDTSGSFGMTATTTGAGDFSLSVTGAAPSAEFFLGLSTATTSLPGCGPVFGLGADALAIAALPLGTAPFHVLTSATGTYAFSLPPASIGTGFTVDLRGVVLGPANALALSAIRRITF